MFFAEIFTVHTSGYIDPPAVPAFGGAVLKDNGLKEADLLQVDYQFCPGITVVAASGSGNILIGGGSGIGKIASNAPGILERNVRTKIAASALPIDRRDNFTPAHYAGQKHQAETFFQVIHVGDIIRASLRA